MSDNLDASAQNPLEMSSLTGLLPLAALFLRWQPASGMLARCIGHLILSHVLGISLARPCIRY